MQCQVVKVQCRNPPKLVSQVSPSAFGIFRLNRSFTVREQENRPGFPPADRSANPIKSLVNRRDQSRWEVGLKGSRSTSMAGGAFLPANAKRVGRVRVKDGPSEIRPGGQKKPMDGIANPLC
ncbi:hypothetical protein Pla52n_50470 [Stieleria varia]|uniref:Uncharacterized protein n=1 Tax=Stieleria varia TaxID=2528005 RepID=A0A5C6AHH7_9BACT|nr:hypothetical protein Pla52n_50470 [Stieleria varia]